MSLEGRNAIITGAGQGLGACIAGQYVDAGASILLCARTVSSLESVAHDLSKRATAGQRIHVRAADVSDPAQVDALIAVARSVFPAIDVLVNNAGVYGPFGALEDIDWTAWVEAIHINLMGTVYPCRAVLPAMKARGRGKIINISGGGATNPMPRVSAYATSKAAVVRFTETLAQEVKSFGIDVNAVAPGALLTRMTEQLLAAGPDVVGADFHARMAKVKQDGGTPLAKGADLAVWLASGKSDGITGKLISAVWDPWTDLQDHRADLDETDIYTLRRIVPKDRGKTWGN